MPKATTHPTNLNEARKAAGFTSTEALRDAMIRRNIPAAAIPSKSTWDRVDRESKNGIDPATNGLDPLLCMLVADECRAPYEVVSPIAATLADPARDLLMRKMRCSSACS